MKSIKQSFVSALILYSVSLIGAACGHLSDPKIKLDESLLVFSPDGGSADIRISSNSEWYAMHKGDRNFFLLSKTGGKGDDVITIFVGLNSSTRSRAETITFTCTSEKGETAQAEMTVAQEGATPDAFVGNWEEVTLPAEGGTISTNVLYNTGWRLSCDDPAVQFSPASTFDGVYFENGIIPVTITVPENSTSVQKVFYVTLTVYIGFSPSDAKYYRFFQKGR